MNALIERSAENRALDRKIWALEAMKGRIIISGGSGGICGILSG
jgi:hypothetical protein